MQSSCAAEPAARVMLLDNLKRPAARRYRSAIPDRSSGNRHGIDPVNPSDPRRMNYLCCGRERRARRWLQELGHDNSWAVPSRTSIQHYTPGTVLTLHAIKLSDSYTQGTPVTKKRAGCPGAPLRHPGADQDSLGLAWSGRSESGRCRNTWITRSMIDVGDVTVDQHAL